MSEEEKRKSREERLDRIFRFALEIDREKTIGRQTYLSDLSRKENDAEHAWHMAVMILLLGEFANEKIDVLHTVHMALIHDLVEIYAGDTYAYDEKGKETQAAREKEAADRLFGLLPSDLEASFRALWEEFEERRTPESRFARLMDNVQPLMLNAAGEGRSWTEHGVALSQVLGRNAVSPEGSAEIWEYAYRRFIHPSVEAGRLIRDREEPFS